MKKKASYLFLFFLIANIFKLKSSAEQYNFNLSLEGETDNFNPYFSLFGQEEILFPMIFDNNPLENPLTPLPNLEPTSPSQLNQFTPLCSSLPQNEPITTPIEKPFDYQSLHKTCKFEPIQANNQKEVKKRLKNLLANPPVNERKIATKNYCLETTCYNRNTCPKFFSNRPSLANHIMTETIQLNPQKFICFKCGKTEICFSLLWEHFASQHYKEYKRDCVPESIPLTDKEYFAPKRIPLETAAIVAERKKQLEKIRRPLVSAFTPLKNEKKQNGDIVITGQYTICSARALEEWPQEIVPPLITFPPPSIEPAQIYRESTDNKAD